MSNEYIVLIKATGAKKKEELPVLCEATDFFIAELTKRKRVPSFEVSIILVGEVDGLSLADKWGECYDMVVDGKTVFVIRLLNCLPFLEMLQTLAHEVVHVIQTARGDLIIDADTEEWIWKRKSYGVAPYTGDDDLDYQALPWEYEAVCKEHMLTKKFLIHKFKNW